MFSGPGILTQLPPCPIRHSASQSCLTRPCLLKQRVTTPPRLIRLKFCKNFVPLTDLGKTFTGRHKRDCLGNTSTKGSKFAHLHNRYIYSPGGVNFVFVIFAPAALLFHLPQFHLGHSSMTTMLLPTPSFNGIPPLRRAP